jgi:hypothetical protein
LYRFKILDKNKVATMKAGKQIEISPQTKVQLKGRSRPPLPQSATAGTPRTLGSFESNRSEDAVSHGGGPCSTRRAAIITLSGKKPTEVGMHTCCVNQKKDQENN